MASSSQTAQPVVVSLDDLKSGNIAFSDLLKAFGPDSLGILVVKDLPSKFAPLRAQVLSNSSRLASLPPKNLSSLTNPDAKYLVGWSHGVETLRPGVVDTAKGSYYINCAFYQDPSLQGADANKFPGFEEYTAPNIWPDEGDIPDFRPSAQELISLIIDTAVLVARACDSFAEREIDGYEKGYLEGMVKRSTTTKARLLHYFPGKSKKGDSAGSENGVNGNHEVGTNGTSSTNSHKGEDGDEVDDSWCTTHLDHGCLTGLTSAMFLDENEGATSDAGEVAVGQKQQYNELPTSPSPKSGLYIRSRSGAVHKVTIPRDCLAFQTGEALELITQGRFKAVPHFVRGVDPSDLEGEKAGMKVARNTLAVFTQPNLDDVVDLRNGLTFGEFARGVVKKNTAG